MIRLALAVLVASLSVLPRAEAQAYPARPVHVVVGVPAGTAADVTVRVLANELGRKLHQRFLVDNKPGANGALAVGFVTSAPPDGYTLLFSASSALTLTPHLSKDLPWNPLADLQPIVELGVTPIAIGVARTSPLDNLDALLAAARTRPGEVRAGILPLSMSEFALRLLESSEHVTFRPVAYTGSSDMIGAMLSGEVQVGFLGIGGIAGQFMPDGKLKPLAMTTTQRIAAFPDTPALDEKVGGYDAGSWFGFFGPKGVDPKAVAAVNGAVNQAITDATVRRSLDELGTTPTGGAPEDLRKRLAADYERFGRLVKQLSLEAGTK